MNNELIGLLRSNLGMPLSAELAADIMLAADRIPALIACDAVHRIKPERYGDFVFSLELIEVIANDIKPLHKAHWDETEGHRHGLPLDPDYPAFIRYEQAGRYVLLTLRMGDRLLGNCAMYLDKSTHTQTIIATEDTLYLLPEARKGRVARQFVAYVERRHAPTRRPRNSYHRKNSQQGRAVLQDARLPPCRKWIDENTGG